MTNAVANAIAITLDKQARASYDAAVAREAVAEGGTPQSPAEYRATLARLQSLQGPGDPGKAVKVH